MKKRFILFAILTICSSTVLKAQWDSVTVFNQVISDLKTFDNKLFIAGGFTQNDGSTCYWSAYYNGLSVTPQTNMIGGTGIRSMAVFGSDLYCADGLDHGSVTGVGKWDGTTWVDGGSTTTSHSVIYADGNDLYVVSDFGPIRKKTGNGSFQPFYSMSGTDEITSIIRYNGLLIFAGSFDTIGGVVAKDIAGWNGTTWQPLGTGISIGTNCMEVYNNELYVAGDLLNAGGLSVNNIAKWNGTSWTTVSNGVTGTSGNGIRAMKATATGLIVVGDFTEMGFASNSADAAEWNGTSWTGLNLVHPDNFVNAVEVFNNTIYVGTFSFTHAHLYRYTGISGINETVENHLITLYPNPCNDVLKLVADLPFSKSVTVQLFDLLGRALNNNNSISCTENNISISTAALKQGNYFIQITDGEMVMRKQFTVTHD